MSAAPSIFFPAWDISLIVTEQRTWWTSGRSRRRGHMAGIDRSSQQNGSKFGQIAAVFLWNGKENERKWRTGVNMKSLNQGDDCCFEVFYCNQL